MVNIFYSVIASLFESAEVAVLLPDARRVLVRVWEAGGSVSLVFLAAGVGV